MPPYWDNKALLHLPYSMLLFLIISLIYLENKCLSDGDMRFANGEKNLVIGGLELGSIALKSMWLTIYAIENNGKLPSF